MRHTASLALFALLFVLASGCGKKAPPPPADGGSGPGVAVQPEAPPDPAADRKKLLANLKSNNQKTRADAIEDLSWLAEDDPAVMPALAEMLRDKGTAGAGRTLANQVNSTREAAALAILKCTNGEKFMKEKGLPVLKEGLSDPSAVIREHTAYTVGQLGALAKPLAPDVQKLCTDPDEYVRGVAFDTLRVTGVADPVALATLLNDKREDVVRLAAGLLPSVKEMPAEAVPPLMAALGGENTNIHAAAAEGLAAAGPKAAPAAQVLADAVKKAYPAEFDRKTARLDGPEVSYWKALRRIGEPAATPTAKLLEHSNLLVRSLAARTLGEMGPPAKGAKDALKKALSDMTVNVSVEAAVALVKIGEPLPEAIDLVKRAIDVPGEGVARYAIEAIPRLGDAGKSLVPLAMAKMGDLNPYTRYAAVWLVGKLPPAEATKYAEEVGKRATDDVSDIRRTVGRVLEQIGPAGGPAADALGKALSEEKEGDIRDQYIEALIAMRQAAKPALPGLLPLVAGKGLPTALRARVVVAAVVADPTSPEVLAAVLKAASDDVQEVRASAARALGALNPLPPDALNALVKLAKSDSKNGPRVAALRALAVAGPKAKAAVPEIDAIANGPQPGLAMWAKVAKAAIDGNIASAAPAIRKGLTDRNVQVRAAAAESLHLVPSQPDDLAALRKLLKDVNGPTRVAAATGVGAFGAAAKEAVPELRRLLNDRETDVRIAGADALGQIGPAAQPAAAKLKDLTRFDPQVKSAAQRALDKIGAK